MQRSSEPDHVQKNHHNNNNRKSKLFIDISSCHAPETHCQATFPSENMTGFISEPLRLKVLYTAKYTASGKANEVS